MSKRRIRKQMYAVSCDGIGLIAGTLAYSRKDAISHLMGGAIIPKEWDDCKRAGYRTVRAVVEVSFADGRHWRT